jgi:hypothetical protein
MLLYKVCRNQKKAVPVERGRKQSEDVDFRRLSPARAALKYIANSTAVIAKPACETTVRRLAN